MLAKYGRQRRKKRSAVTNPAAGIWQINVLSRPRRAALGAPHVGGDRSNYRDHDFGAKQFQYPRQANFAIPACFPALLAVHAIDRLSTHVDQIASKLAKRVEKIVLMDIRAGVNECVSNRPVKS